MKSKKLWKRVLYYGSLIIAIIIIQMIIKIGMEGMWLFGIPKAEDVTSVTIKYPSLTEQNLEITDSEQIELCVNLSGFLKYKPFVDGDAKFTHTIYAVAKCESNDDVLYRVEENDYRIYHLTYSKNNTEGYPRFISFDGQQSVINYIEKEYVDNHL